MPTLTKWQVKLSNDNVSSDNYQLVGFDFNTDLTTLEQAARIIRYLGGLSAVSVLAAGTRIVQCAYRLTGSPGLVPELYPVAEIATLSAALSAAGLTPVVTGTAYLGTSFGIGALCPLGSSCSVSETTNVPGRTGRGRHFTPFLSADAIDGAGKVGAIPRVNIGVQATACFKGTFGGALISGVISATPVLAPGADTTPIVIQAYTPQPVASNLESRRR